MGMIDWRSLLRAPQYPQNEQNRRAGRHIADSADREALMASIAPGTRITWERGHGTAQNGVVDFLHIFLDEVWAFCSCPDGGWCVVNTKYILKSEGAGDA